IHFQQVSDSAGVDIRIGGSTIDGPYAVLGITHWTFSGSQISTADIELDTAENWTLNASGISVFSVAVHEIGHAIGLAHSGGPAVMEPYNHNYQALQSIDIAAVRAIYGIALNHAFVVSAPGYVPGHTQTSVAATSLFTVSDADHDAITN